MKTFKLDREGDLVIKDGNLEMVEDTEERTQSVWVTLSINLNEWFLNADFGLDYSVFMTKNFNKDDIALALQEAILLDDRIAQAEITKIELNKRNRMMYIEGYAYDLMDNRIDIEEVIGID